MAITGLGEEGGVRKSMKRRGSGGNRKDGGRGVPTYVYSITQGIYI